MWVVFDQAVGYLGHPRGGPCWTWIMGNFGSWTVLVISPAAISSTLCLRYL